MSPLQMAHLLHAPIDASFLLCSHFCVCRFHSTCARRAYRIGQQRSVVVYRLITCGTIEEKIYRKQVFKDSINQQVTGDSNQPLRYFEVPSWHLAEAFLSSSECHELSHSTTM